MENINNDQSENIQKRFNEIERNSENVENCEENPDNDSNSGDDGNQNFFN